MEDTEKTITSGSDNSAGLLVKPDTDDELEKNNTKKVKIRATTDQAAKLIEAAMRGLTYAIMKANMPQVDDKGKIAKAPVVNVSEESPTYSRMEGIETEVITEPDEQDKITRQSEYVNAETYMDGVSTENEEEGIEETGETSQKNAEEEDVEEETQKTDAETVDGTPARTPNGIPVYHHKSDKEPATKSDENLWETLDAPMYLPGHRVYSKSLRSLGEIQLGEKTDGSWYYTIKLVNSDNVFGGTAVVQENDLQPRSMRAVKYAKDFGQKREVEIEVKPLIDSIQSLCDKCQDYKVTPIKEKDLEAIETQCKNILRGKTFRSVIRNNAARKYVRAIQDIQHGIAAASHLIRNANEESADGRSHKNDALEQGQYNAYMRCTNALARAKEVLQEKVPLRSYGSYKRNE